MVARTPLLYSRGADERLDRPAHVRAGSSLVAWNRHLAVIQDDASFLAVIDLEGRTVRGVPFPMAVRQFDDTRGNKKLKLDLEAAFVTPDGGLLVALGSGSSPLRERVVLVEHPGSESPDVSLVEAPALYAALRSEAAFSGSELNVEGATILGEDVILFQRGNGAPAAHRPAVDATARIGLGQLLTYLRGDGPAPPLRDVTAWDLGAKEGARLTFTDGAISKRGVIAFLACAEDSPDATRDGPVSAVAIGCLDEAQGTSEVGWLLDERGLPLLDKAEGLSFDPSDETRAFVVTDRDDPTAPSELLEIRLGEAWFR